MKKLIVEKVNEFNNYIHDLDRLINVLEEDKKVYITKIKQVEEKLLKLKQNLISTLGEIDA